MSYTATNGNQESGIFKMLSGLGKAIGVGVAILGTPVVYGRTKGSIFGYLSSQYGHEPATWLTWIMGAVEAYILYAVTSLAFAAFISYLLAAMAARRYQGE